LTANSKRFSTRRGRSCSLDSNAARHPAAPERPASGAIYIYCRQRYEFYALCFDGPDGSLTAQDFCKLLPEFNLLKYAEHLALLQAQFQSPGSA